MNIKKHIPNALTCGNLFCGCLAIVFAFEGNLVVSAYLVGLAAVLDFFDGFVARLLNVGGELGKQLDSLADMVTFGVVPAVVMYHLLAQAFWGTHMDYQDCQPETMASVNYYSYFAYTPFLIAVFSALRLAKFNIDTRQTTSFIGVPTPANAILICSLPLILEQKTGLACWILNPYLLVLLTLLMSFLLVAELPLFALKFKNFGWVDNKIRYLFLIVSVLLLVLLQFLAIPFIIFLYIILSIVNNFLSRNSN
jgi:CDP-diacylglycerol--serine O-phosphatidyltransferase